MMDIFLKIKTILVLFFLFFSPVFAETDSINVTQEVSASSGSGSNSSSGSNAASRGVDESFFTPKIMDFSVNAWSSGAVISWKTDRPTKYKLSFGLDYNYLDGYFFTDSLSESHQVVLENLAPNTTYFLKIEASDSLSRKSYIIGESFKTSKNLDLSPPKNIGSLTYYLEGNDFFMRWSNPEDSDFKSVRIMRSDSFYLTDPKEGYLVFDGDSGYFMDKSLSFGKTYYYTLFSYDYNFNYSSGAVVSVFVPFRDDVVEDDNSVVSNNDDSGGVDVGVFYPEKDSHYNAGSKTDDFGGKNYIDDNLRADKVDNNDIIQDNLDDKAVDDSVESISIYDFLLYQGGRKIEYLDNYFSIDGSIGFSLYLSIDKLPVDAKSILLNFRNKNNDKDVRSYLLRLNKEKNIYESSINPFNGSGEYLFNIVILNDNNKSIKDINANAVFYYDENGEGIVFMNSLKWSVFFILVAFSLLIIVRFSRRLNEFR